MNLLRILEKIPYAVLVALLVLISISNLDSDFLFIDDITLIVNNPHLNFSLANLATIFAKPLGQIFDAADSPIKYIYYRPALDLLYMLNTVVWGVNPVGFHLSNLLLHLFTTILIYRTGLLLFDNNKGVSLLAAALFSVHPVHNELIGRVAMNENLLGFFMMAALYTYLQGRRYLSLCTFALALLTKESAIMLPFVLLFFEMGTQKLKAAALALRSYAVIIAAYVALRTMVVGMPNVAGIDSSWLESFITASAALAAYLRLLFMPYPLSIFYPVFKLVSPLQSELFLAMVICPLLAVVIWKWKNDKLLLPLLLGTVILLAPVVFKANMMILGLDRAFIAERQLYVPAAFFALLIAALLKRYALSSAGKYALTALMFILPLLAYSAVASTAVWKKSDSVFAVFMRDYPETSVARNQRGVKLLEKGNLDEALAEFRAALPAVKKESFTGIKLGSGSEKDKKFSGLGGLMEKYDIAAYQAQYADIHFNIGQVYDEKKDYETAMRKYKTVLALKPHSIEARTALANIYLKKGMFPDASREYRLALKDIDAFKRR